MDLLRVYTGLGLAACLVLTGCNSSSSPSPSPTPQVPNLSGDYIGTLNDSQGGNGSATATLAQHGSSAGGAVTVTQTGGTIVAQISLAIASSNALSGSMVVNYANGTTCTFSTTGTYNSSGSTPVISGSYTAVTNCAGNSGTYTLNQQCLDTITAADRRAMALPPHC